MNKITIETTLNGEPIKAEVDPRRNLADFLRTQCGLTGTHVGCEHGACGACTVQVDGVAVRGCLMFAVQADGADVRTVEDLGSTERLSILQAAFRESHALQCGFCTPGILMTMDEFLREMPNPTREDIRTALTGNICRCTGYQAIVEAVAKAAERLAQTPETV